MSGIERLKELIKLRDEALARYQKFAQRLAETNYEVQGYLESDWVDEEAILRRFNRDEQDESPLKQVANEVEELNESLTGSAETLRSEAKLIDVVASSSSSDSSKGGYSSKE